MNTLKKIWTKRKDLYYIIPTIYFNFHYLPFKQAIKLPIILYKPSLKKIKGKIIIDKPNVKYGMIRLGFHRASIYPNNGIMFQNHGGTVIFKGKCMIGGNSYISVGKTGKIIFGDDFKTTASIKIISFVKISFGTSTRVGWDCMFMDTNFHPLKKIETKEKKKASGPISIGDFNWFGNKCTIMHSVNTPERCIFGLTSIVTRGTKCESYCVHGGNPVKVLTKGVYRDLNDDNESYS